MKLKNNFIMTNDNEEIIGKIKDVEIEFIKLIKTYIKDDNSIDEFIGNLSIISDLLNDLEKEFEENSNAIIKVWCNPMGCYNYTIL